MNAWEATCIPWFPNSIKQYSFSKVVHRITWKLFANKKTKTNKQLNQKT
jgi:hypothetical protein